MTWRKDDPMSLLQITPWGKELTHELIGEEQHSLEAELAMTEVEEVLERWSEEIDNHGVVVAFGAEPANERYTDATGESLVDFGFIFELGVLGLDRFELDGDFFAGDGVYAGEDGSWCGEQGE